MFRDIRKEYTVKIRGKPLINSPDSSQVLNLDYRAKN